MVYLFCVWHITKTLWNNRSYRRRHREKNEKNRKNWIKLHYYLSNFLSVNSTKVYLKTLNKNWPRRSSIVSRLPDSHCNLLLVVSRYCPSKTSTPWGSEYPLRNGLAKHCQKLSCIVLSSYGIHSWQLFVRSSRSPKARQRLEGSDTKASFWNKHNNHIWKSIDYFCKKKENQSDFT